MGNWIAGAIKRPGQLHRDLGVPQGKKIPPYLVAEAAKRKGRVGQEARLAQTLKELRPYKPMPPIRGGRKRNPYKPFGEAPPLKPKNPAGSGPRNT